MRKSAGFSRFYLPIRAFALVKPLVSENFIAGKMKRLAV